MNIGGKHLFRLHSVFAGETGGAEAAVGVLGQLDDVLRGEVAQRVGTNDLVDLVHRAAGSDQKLLVATGRTVDQINEIIGADTLGYLSTEHVVQLAQNANCGFCTACFTGKYAVKPEEVLSTDIHERHLNDRPKDEKKLGE